MGLNCLDDRVPCRRRVRQGARVPKFWIFAAAVAVYGFSYVIFAGRAKNRGFEAGGDTIWAFHQLRPGAREHECASERVLFVVYYPLIRVDRALGYRHAFDGTVVSQPVKR